MRIPFFIRLSASIIIIQLIMLSILVWNNIRISTESHTELLVNTSRDQSTLLAAAIAPGLLAYDIALVEDALSLLNEKHDLAYAEVFDLTSRLVASIGQQTNDNAFDPDEDYIERLENGIFHISRLIKVENQIVGGLRVGYSARQLNEVNDEMRWQNLVLTIVTMLVLTIATLVISRLLTAKIRTINEGVNQFRQGDLGYRIKVPVNDELGDVAESFNQMANVLGQTQSLLVQERSDLEQRVKERTYELSQTNKTLKAANEELNRTHIQMVENEKMAALGDLVSSVAQEVDTTLGESVKEISHIDYEANYLSKSIKEGAIKPSMLEDFVGECLSSTQISLSNLKKAGELNKNFKEVAVDQSTEEARNVDMGDYIQEILSSLYPKFNKTRVSIKTELQDSVVIMTFPGMIAQIMTNLLINALIHAFNNGKSEGLIIIRLKCDKKFIRIEIEDNGAGMDEKTAKYVFDPFFTTQLESGGTGLGLHIVYNLVTQKLNGHIKCESE
ncbi:MAG: HAMP domain-containing protein, partial [Gammaproteobacteria bacterium]|nr:HAMP domain-containing protein [Gammaproteobacteria bacterium]